MFVYIEESQLRGMLEQAELRLKQTGVEYLGAIKAKMEIEEKIIIAAMTNKRIFDGDRVFVEFSDGGEECVYEGTRQNSMHQRAEIVFRHLTKSGKPRRHPTLYNMSFAAIASRVESGD